MNERGEREWHSKMARRRAALPALLFGCILAGTTTAWADNWPQFRGEYARGIDDSVPLPTTWNVQKGENILWEIPVPGRALASPIVWGNRIYIATAVEFGKSNPKVDDRSTVQDDAVNQWRMLAIDRANGAIVWDTLVREGVPKVMRHISSSHANSTPATDGKRIVVIYSAEGMFCLDASGKLLWEKDLGPMDSGYYQMPRMQWGYGSSPVIHDGKVIVLCDVQKGSFIALCDVATGKEIWRTPREDVPSSGTPTIVTTAGRKQIVVNGWRQAGGYDFETGQELWRHNGGGDIPIPTPIAGHDLIYLTSAHGRDLPIRAIRADANGDISADDAGAKNPAVAWQHERLGAYVPTPILIGSSVFSTTNRGVLTCIDAKSGDIHFTEAIAMGNMRGGGCASPVSDGRHIYFTSTNGTVFVVPVQNKLSVVAANRLGDPCDTTPAISNGEIFFRTKGKLIAVGARR